MVNTAVVGQHSSPHHGGGGNSTQDVFVLVNGVHLSCALEPIRTEGKPGLERMGWQEIESKLEAGSHLQY
jgi:hypothetical protein